MILMIWISYVFLKFGEVLIARKMMILGTSLGREKRPLPGNRDNHTESFEGFEWLLKFSKVLEFQCPRNDPGVCLF